MKKIVNNEYVEMTPAEIAQWEADQDDYMPPSPPLSRQQIAAARLPIDGGELGGIERSIGLSFAMVIDGMAEIFFDEQQPDTAYIVTPADGVQKFTDRVVIPIENLSAVALIIERVQ